MTSAHFVPGEQALISRDLATVKLWDLRRGANTSMVIDSGSETKPVYSAQVTDYIMGNLSSLMEHDRRDNFFVEASPNGKYIATGAYGKTAHVLNVNATANQTVACKFDRPVGLEAGIVRPYNNKKQLEGRPSQHSPANLLQKQVTMGAWKPIGAAESSQTSVLALAQRNCVYLYKNGASSAH